MLYQTSRYDIRVASQKRTPLAALSATQSALVHNATGIAATNGFAGNLCNRNYECAA